MLERGWNVLAIDGEPASISHLLAKISKEGQARLQTQVAKFEAVNLSPADLIHASFSLPFCPPEHFETFWAKIVKAIKPGGRFAGQLFGVRECFNIHHEGHEGTQRLEKVRKNLRKSVQSVAEFCSSEHANQVSTEF